MGKCERRSAGGVGKCGKVCLGVREGDGRCGIGIGKCVGMWKKMWESVWDERGEVGWGVGGSEEKNGEKYGVCGEGKKRCGGRKKVLGEVWESV